MILRIVAALVGLAALLPILFFAGPVGVHLIVPPALAWCALEYSRMAFPTGGAPAFLWVAGASLVTYGFALYGGTTGAVVGSGLVFVATCVRVVLRPGESLEGAFADLGRYVLGITWISLLVFLPMLRDLEYGLGWVFVALGVAWLADTGAYFTGRLIGRTPLDPVLSPNKTVEGYVGGIVLSTVGVFLISWLGVPNLSPVGALVLGVGGGTLGVAGDLAESLIKRATGVKDAGNIMPGHGGLLDRIDSLLFVVPAVYGYAVYLNGP